MSGANRIEITMSDEQLAALVAVRRREPRAAWLGPMIVGFTGALTDK